MKSIVLIGFMGAGKSAVGRELARRLGLPRRDTDEMIRQRFAKTISQIFADDGEDAFRQAETDLLHEMRNFDRLILVTGGGIILREENVSLLASLGWTCWLDGNEEDLWQRASLRHNRPLLQGEDPRARFGALLRERFPRYQAVADTRIDTTEKSITEVTDEIIAQL